MLTRREKEAAREHLGACKDGISNFKAIAALLGLAIAVVQPVSAAYIALAALFTALLERQGRKAERAAEDPPRQDYKSRTFVQWPFIEPNIVLSDNPFVSVALPAADTLRKTTGYLSAVVRAVERAQGAVAARDIAARDARLSEARGFANELRDLGAVTRRSLSALADELRRSSLNHSLLETLRGLPPPGGTVGELPHQTQDRLYRRLAQAGIRLPALPVDRARHLDMGDIQRAAESLLVVGRTAEDLGNVLAKEGFVLRV